MGMDFSIVKIKATPIQVYHPSINIDGNDELDAFCAGNGTFGNTTHPHRIENFEILSDGPQNGLKLANTDRYLIIQNVNITQFFQSTTSRGIYIINCTHITIDNCHFYNNSLGIVFENTNISQIWNTSGSINKETGVTFINSHLNYVYNLVAFQNDENGMELLNSNNNTIEYSIFLENLKNGLLLQNSFYNVIFDSYFLYNGEKCYSNPTDPEKTNQFYNNSCKRKGIPGIPIGIMSGVSICTIVVLVLITKRHKNKRKIS